MGSIQNDRVARKRMKRQWRTWGMSEKEIGLCARQVEERQNLKRNGQLPLDAPLCTRAEYVRLMRQQPSVKPQGAAVLRLGEDYEAPDDTGYRPPKIDSVLVGVARATGATARAVKRGKTMTRSEHAEGRRG